MLNKTLVILPTLCFFSYVPALRQVLYLPLPSPLHSFALVPFASRAQGCSHSAMRICAEAQTCVATGLNKSKSRRASFYIFIYTPTQVTYLHIFMEVGKTYGMYSIHTTHLILFIRVQGTSLPAWDVPDNHFVPEPTMRMPPPDMGFVRTLPHAPSTNDPKHNGIKHKSRCAYIKRALLAKKKIFSLSTHPSIHSSAFHLSADQSILQSTHFSL